MSISTKVTNALEELSSVLLATGCCEASVTCTAPDLNEERILRLRISAPNTPLFRAVFSVLATLYEFADCVELYKFSSLELLSPNTSSESADLGKDRLRVCIEVNLYPHYDEENRDVYDCPRFGAFLEVINRFHNFIEVHLAQLLKQLNVSNLS